MFACGKNDCMKNSEKTLPRVRLSLSHRTAAEQSVGLGIIAFGSMLFAYLNQQLYKSGNAHPWITASWNLPVMIAIHTCVAIAFWLLWRSTSLRKMKPELYLYLTSFAFESAWTYSLYKLHLQLLALGPILLWMTNLLVITGLFWKKDRAAGSSLILALAWTFYLMSINIMLCITNP
jgi:tryptophan-rich sensory protein